jgi:uncharacterized membrane protein
MAPFGVLVVSWIVFRVVGAAGLSTLDGWQHSLRGALALMFLLTATTHFSGRRREDLIEMVPKRLKYPALLVTITGVLEFLGAFGLLIPLTAPAAAICLALLLIVMFPANVDAARRQLTLSGHRAMSLVPRGILQLVFIICALAAA